MARRRRHHRRRAELIDWQEDVERVLLFEELRTAACGQNEMQQPHKVATPRLEMRHRNNMGKLALYER